MARSMSGTHTPGSRMRVGAPAGVVARVIASHDSARTQRITTKRTASSRHIFWRPAVGLMDFAAVFLSLMFLLGCIGIVLGYLMTRENEPQIPHFVPYVPAARSVLR